MCRRRPFYFLIYPLLTSHFSLLTSRFLLLPYFLLPATEQVWADFDPDADQKIPGSNLPDLVSRIPPPMGVAGQDKRDGALLAMAGNSGTWLSMVGHVQPMAEHGQQWPDKAGPPRPTKRQLWLASLLPGSHTKMQGQPKIARPTKMHGQPKVVQKP